jgi:hypothetical protein
MSKKMVYLVSIVVALSLVGDAQADINWIDSTGDHLWSTPGNWDTGTLPVTGNVSAGKVRIQVVPGPIVAKEGAECFNIRVGNNATGDMTVDGGTLAVDGWIALGRNAGGEATLNMISGTITANDLNIAEVGSLATLNMTGGNITLRGTLRVGRSGPGHANLAGGIITTNDFNMGLDTGGVGTMNITAGTLIINGDRLSLVQGYIDKGWITAYSGNGTLPLDYDVTEDKTTLKAVHMLDPNPVDGGLALPGEVELSWTLPDPCVPGQPVLVDVYFTDNLQSIEQFTDPAAIQVVSKQNVTSVVVQTQLKTRYYWAVDTYIGDPSDPLMGPIFSFLADNAPPSVNAGPDISTILQDGTRTGPLNGIVTDDGAIQPYTVMWSVLEQPSDADPTLPGAVIADPTAEQTMVTVSAEGTYVLQLEAYDGEYTGSDTMTINVHPDDWR